MTEPHEYCMDKLVSGGRCCPDGLHRTDCKIIPVIEGHNKQLQAKRDPERRWTFGDAIATFVVTTVVSFAFLWRFLA